MAAEDIGTIYPTKIPGYEDAADIQAALKLYHYGTSSTVSTEGDIVANSVVGYLKSLDTRLDDLEDDPLGASVVNTMPTSVENGYIWVDGDSSITTDVQYAISTYQSSEPSSPTIGSLWVDSDSSPLTLYVWSGTEWRAIGS